MNPYVILGAVVLWGASVAGVGYWQNQAGHTAERVSWQTRETKELQDANAKILELEAARRAEEQRHADAVADISQTYEKEKADAASQKARDVAAARAGALRLLVPARCPDANRNKTGAVAAGAGERDGGARSELPREIAANLFALADDADEIVKQLSACQGIVRADRSP